MKTQTKNKTTQKADKKIEALFQQLKTLNDELDDCLFANCNSIMSKDELMNFVNKCKNKTQHIKSYTKKIIENIKCKHKILLKNKPFAERHDKMFVCYNKNCSEKIQKYFKLIHKITNLINPDITKQKIYHDTIDKLFDNINKCYKDNCDHIFPRKEENEIYDKCRNNNSKKFKKCLEESNYNKKVKEMHDCQRTKCKKIGNQTYPKIKLLTKKKQDINKKTTKLLINAKKKYGIVDRYF
jgi:hypothetical protein